MKNHYAADGVADRLDAVHSIARNGIETEGFFYSNDGFALASAMMEQATGLTFEQILSQEVFVPAGMNASGVWGEPIDQAQFAPFSKPSAAGWMRDGNPARHYGALGSGGLFSTAEDMLRLINRSQRPRRPSPISDSAPSR